MLLGRLCSRSIRAAAASSIKATRMSWNDSNITPRNLDHSCREAKQDTRTHVKNLLKQMKQDDMVVESTKITQHVLASQAFVQASRIGMYVHCSRLKEVDTGSLLNTALTTGETTPGLFLASHFKNPLRISILRKGKRCYVPVVEDKSSNMRLLHLDDMSGLISVPPFGILEPALNYDDGAAREDVLQATVHLDMLLMPGLGFDSSGRRLGRGGGYYDKMLSLLKQQAVAHGRKPPLLVALAYSTQIVKDVPVDAHDQQLDVIVTPGGPILCSESARFFF